MIDFTSMAQCAAAMSHPHRLKLLNVLESGGCSVEALAANAGLSMANASRHLQILRRAFLVDAAREGKNVIYTLRNRAIYGNLIGALAAAQGELDAAMDDLKTDYLQAPEKLEPIAREELLSRLRKGEVTLIDVRAAAEFEIGHIEGALNLPLADLRRRLALIPGNREIVAYCRGPHCVLSRQAVLILQHYGFRARRLAPDSGGSPGHFASPASS
ncbi:ArsR/SmtB family transcription factor [Swaminathania salitolerans]|uniref:ArsR family transcriptional regulator n=1 Tax=Swaminathania salitolerans TaxID=182838 RepID=A0A511BP90_9PROT|nr:metalloregulator ArsR/SmtB family transcription factor [Swaminathania salitolerans]GBQ10756.1 ArsR family transcriptional regulator [Swaminathania salitolerans LMG 21291]GEL02159.1 ArsR family transcriptional regulator [Swaminathania salitolerans]